MKPAILGYRLDRIHAPVVLARSFEYPSDFCLSDYISHAPEYELAPSDTGVLAVRFMKPVASQLRETPIAPDQIEEINHDGSVTIRCSVVLNERLRKWLRSYGADVEVIDPPTLRQHFATTAKTAARYYARK
jgi:predicted DNA-binding transcriptional regulator YafY